MDRGKLFQKKQDLEQKRQEMNRRMTGLESTRGKICSGIDVLKKELDLMSIPSDDRAQKNILERNTDFPEAMERAMQMAEKTEQLCAYGFEEERLTEEISALTKKQEDLTFFLKGVEQEISASEKPKAGSEEQTMVKEGKLYDPQTERTLNQIVCSLESYYPEHQIFALDSIDSSLREKIAEIYKSAGFSTVEELYAAYGFRTITANEVRELRSYVIYTPGHEPECVESKIKSVLSRLEQYYPDHIVSRGMQNDHKSLAKDISGLYQWLGYEDTGAMLEAYGYTYNVQKAGRPESEYQPMIDALVEKYSEAPKCTTMGMLIYENSEYKAALKTLSNRSNEFYGMSLRQYFLSIGILEPKNAAVQKETQEEGQDGKQENSMARAGLSLSGCLSESVKGASCFAVSGSAKGYTVTGYNGNAEEVIIPDVIGGVPVIAIGKGAFRDNTMIRTVAMPDTILSVGSDAFRGCTSLRTVHLSESITKIISTTFMDCVSLEKVNIPDQVTELKRLTFRNSPLCTLIIGKSLTDLSKDMFYTKFDEKGYRGIRTIQVSKENPHLSAEGGVVLSADGSEILCCLSDPQYISIPYGVVKIRENAFQGCRSLKNVDFPSTLRNVGKNAFAETALENYPFGPEVTVEGGSEEV